MSDFERFTEFLRREAPGYNEAARVPVEVMWGGVEVGLGDGEVVVGSRPSDGVVAGWEGVVDREADGLAIDALGYNDAPPAPRAEMWGRIEAAWGLRGGGVVGEGQSGIGEGAEGVVPGLPAERPGAWRWPSRQRWPERRRVVGWAVALAAAASVVLGIALGRDARETQPGEVGGDPAFATVPTETATPPPTDAETPQPALPAEPEPPVVAASILPLPGASVDLQAAAIPVEIEPQVVRFTDATLTARTAGLPSSLTFRRDRETIRFLGRTETLLTAFRTDQRTPLTERDLAVWGRELLIETRMHLDLQVSRTPEELALLQDLELVMLQISRLGSGAPDVEWQLAREGMEFKSALPRVRAAAAADGL